MTRTTTEHTLDLTIGDTVIVTARVEVEWRHDPGTPYMRDGHGEPPETDAETVTWTTGIGMSSEDAEQTELHREIDAQIAKAIDRGEIHPE